MQQLFQQVDRYTLLAYARAELKLLRQSKPQKERLTAENPIERETVEECAASDASSSSA
jgi:predicted NUDIX family NTP pyrophosphohydrolase